jgi:hypothetical protein
MVRSTPPRVLAFRASGFGAFVDGQPTGGLTRDHILDNLSLYWLTGTGASAARSYWESGRAQALAASQAPPEVSLPVGFTTFPDEIFRAPAQLGRAELPHPHLLQRGRAGRAAALSGCRCWRASREATERTARSSASLIPLRTWRSSGPLSRLSRSIASIRWSSICRHGGPGASGRQDGHRRPGACFAAPLLAGERGHDLPRSGWAGGRIRVVGLWGGPDLTAPLYVNSGVRVGGDGQLPGAGRPRWRACA